MNIATHYVHTALAVSCLAIGGSCCLSSGGGSLSVPPQAAAVGYHTLTFGPAVALGTNWYPWEFYGSGSQPAGYATQNADGSLAISGL